MYFHHSWPGYSPTPIIKILKKGVELKIKILFTTPLRNKKHTTNHPTK
jgi:hypothetical protein